MRVSRALRSMVLALPLVGTRGLQDSFAVVPGIRQVSKARLHELVDQTSQAVVERLTIALEIYLGD